MDAPLKANVDVDVDVAVHMAVIIKNFFLKNGNELEFFCLRPS